MEELQPLDHPKIDAELEKSLRHYAKNTAFTISSTRQPDMPIVYASDGFLKMTGYERREEVLGKNCRFLQGAGTSRQMVMEVRNCIQEDRGCTVCLLNYRKDGRPFWNQLCLTPVLDNLGVAYYIGIQTDVTGMVLAHRSKLLSPYSTIPGPHQGVHDFRGCPGVVEAEKQQAAELGGTLRRWHTEHIPGSAEERSCGPVSCSLLPPSLLNPLMKLQQSFVLVDPQLPDCPIVYASEAFVRLTGRPRDQVIGHNCRFMQGPGTDQAEVQRLREAIADRRPVTVRLLNYRHDGAPFWNSLHVAPVRNADGEVVFLVGVQLDITAPHAADSQGARQAGGVEHGAGTLDGGNGPQPQAAADLHANAKQGQRSVVGTVRVVCRSLDPRSGLRRSLEDQHRPEHEDVPIELPSKPCLLRVSMPTLASSTL